MTYVAHGYGGWMMVLDAPNLQTARNEARASAGSASLTPGDIHTVRQATDDEIAWYKAMTG